MKKNLLKIIVPIFFYFFVANVFAQYRNSKEVGLFVGPTFFATDYGQRSDANSYLKNAGAGFGALYYINFTDNSFRWRGGSSNYFAYHFKIRTELSYTSAKLEHYGHYVNDDKVSEGSNKLRAMHGKASVFDIGAQLEYHFFEKMLPRLPWSPYASIGLTLNFYKPSLEFDGGDWQQDPSILFPKWADPGDVDISSGVTGGVTGALGSRIKINQFSDIMVELRWQYYFNDWIDGLDAQNDSSNKYNDWTFFPHVGYIFYLE